eukprot:TRINITY_DN1796_c0_g1_i14.p1 TRINITY_DN1796_c0_g1~~TRINITY_DN1796_c0_g1_i14.p1  ORF type:complete len:2047 (+),score=311.96 TRINITY_DN1796_c0_g1_i14:175-6315(+)
MLAMFSMDRRPKEEFRSVHVNKPEQNALYRYCGNVTTTSKYSTVSFLPKNLFEQFRRIANVYFLVISILQLSTNLSPTNKYATIGPLCCVLFVNMVKEGFEDYARHQSDEKVNQRKSIQLLNGKDQSLLWQDVSVGAICKVIEGQECPADMVLLVSSHTQGHCYVETANLDGETNLKVLYSLKETQEIKSLDGLNKLQGAVKCEHPNSRLYSFTGTLYPTQGSEVSIDISNVILRGTVLRNTPFVYGLVIFTGADTKIIQNSREVPSKRSYLEKQINHTLIYIFLGLALLCMYFTLAHILWVFENDSEVWYLDYLRDENGADSASSFITFLILYNNLTPISLYVSMEFVRLYQAKFIDNDLKMYHETSDTPAKARTSNLNEELGQIQYVLSDKTGTLTCNEMKFSKCSIGGQLFEMGGQRLERNLQDTSSTSKTHARIRIESASTELGAADGIDFLQSCKSPSPLFDSFLLVMGICHTAIPSLKENAVSGSTSAQIEYQSPSPDEVALLNAARLAQFVLEERSQSQVVLNIRGERRVYEILNINEFNSVRKRMSIIVKTPEDKIMLFCKGADSVMLERLSPNQPSIQDTLSHIDRFANEGLRTLVLAMAELSEEEYHIWHMKFKDASTSLTNRQTLLDEAAAMIESNLTLLGATGVEDRLQDLVPDTIQTLMRAGIRVWMLTGDKQETAMNIAYSTRLFHNEMHIMKINTHDEGKLMSLIDGGIKKFQEQFEKNNTLFGLVVDGATFHILVQRPDIKHRFCKLMKICTSVVACRVSPAQKAEIVQLVRSSESPEPFTLAIGDGGNDVNMIQEAHIGVGISGKEGMQAVQSSDFAIAQFRFLKDLLLIHGKWNYYRMCKFIMYSFYKNITFVTVLVFFTMDNGYSGTTLFDSWLGAGWNVIWTFLPIIVFAITDKDCSAKMMETFPHLYMYGPLSLGYSVSKFGKWVACGLIHATIIYYLCKGAYQGVLSSEGYSDGLFFFGTIVNGALMLVVNLKILIEAHSLNKIFVGSVVLSVISWFLFVGVYSFLYAISPDFYHVGTELFSRSIFWVGLPLVPTACILVDYIGKIVKNTYRPTPFDVANEIEYLMQRQPKMQEKTLNEGKMQPVMMVAQSPRVAFVSEAEDPSASNQTPHQLTTASVFESSPNIEVEEPSVIYHDIPMNKYTLEFSDYPRLEHRLQGHHFLRVRHLSRVIWVMVYFYTVIVYIFTYLRRSDMRSGFSAQVTLITIYGMYTLFLFSSLRKKYFQELIMVCFVMFRIVGEFSSSTSERMLYQIITPPIGFLLSGMRFKQSFVVVAISVIYYIATLVSTSWSSQSSYSALGTLISFAVSAAGAYKHEKSMRRDFLLRQELRIEKSVTRSILENMIPPFIANKIKDGYTSIANAEPSVSVLFCEIMDFEDIVSDTSPEEFIRMLDKIFNHFDGLCELYDVQKIETVGPVYMACAGLQNSGVNHALSVAKLAENMLADSPKFIRQNGLPVRIRIGINTGPVVSGVVGKKKPQYCLFGDTVNTASRMESTAPPLSVQVTHTTFKSIQSNYGAIERTIHAKGKGEMKVYILITDETSSLTLHSNDRKNSKKAPVYDAGLVSIQDLREYLEDDVSTTTQDINYYNLRFLSRRVEAEYEAETEEENQWQFRANMLLFVTIAIIITTADERKAFETVSGQVASALMIALVAICTLFAVYRSSAWFLRHKQYYVTFAYLYFGVMGSAYFMIRGNEDVGVWPSAVSSIWSILVAVFGGLRLPETVFLCAVVIFISLGSVVSDDSFHDKEWLRKNKMNISSEGVLVTYLIFNLLIVILFKYYKDYYGRRAFLMRSSIYQETKTSNQLLNSMVPDGVLRQLRIGTGVVAQVYRNVAILYSDIVGFTSTSSKSDPHEIVQMLSLLFSTLDVQSAIHEVYKVQTIGDAYVAVAGIPIHDEDEQDPIHPCMKMMKFANGMIRAVSTMTTPGGSPLRVRIGVHYGSIVGGVIGRKSLRFDIWGKDAIIAARLESQGLPGMVHMSSEFMHQVQKDYTISCCRYSKFGGEERTKTFFYDPSIDISGNPNPKNS